MKLKISQKADEFFSLFLNLAETLRRSVEQLSEMVDDFEDIEAKAARLTDREHEADEITHSIIRLLNTAFLTPIDREDVYALASALDVVVDSTEAAGDMLVLHQLREPMPEMKAQVDILLEASALIENGIAILPRMNRAELEPYWIEINRLENMGDQEYRRALAHLYSGNFKTLFVLKRKEIIEEIENGIDGLENAANVIESIVLKST